MHVARGEVQGERRARVSCQHRDDQENIAFHLQLLLVVMMWLQDRDSVVTESRPSGLAETAAP